jgi:predicted RND superfamily exporter protein
MRKIAEFCCTASTPIIVIVAIINIAAFASLFSFKLDTDFLNFFTSGNSRTEEFDRLQEKYKTDEAISILIEQGDSLLEEENLLRIYSLQKEIEHLIGVSGVESFIPSEISVEGHIIQVDEKFIARHSDILEDFIKQNDSLAVRFLSSDNSKSVVIASLESDAVAGDVVESLERIIRTEESWTLSLAGLKRLSGITLFE